MSNKRVYQVAKDYNISSDALLSMLKDLGFSIKSHMSVVEEMALKAIEDKFKKEKEELKKEDDLKKKKLEEREKLEEERHRVESFRESAKDKLKFRDLSVKSKDDLLTFEKKKKGRFKKGKPERQVNPKEVEASVKKTLAQFDTLKKLKKYRKKDKEETGEGEEATKKIQVTEYMSVAELANLMGVKPSEVISKCLELGFVASINQRLDLDTLETIALEFEFEVEELKEIGVVEEEEAEEAENLKPRAPVVTIMGHVDHGKTSLLDYIRKSNIIAGEFGGITQHIGAYEVVLPKGRITFLDTPGHEAFTAMRARGAQVTDIVVLVIAADDAVMPQTIEAIDHAKAAGVPIIVAINKMDLPSADAEPIKHQISKYGLVPEEWGGKTVICEISAKTGNGVEHLLEMILLQAEMLELKTDPDKNASGIVIESRLDRGRGPTATVLIQKGTLNIGDIFVTGSHYGRVRAMLDERGNYLKAAGPSTPVQVLGSSGVPQAGDSFMVTETEQEAREISNRRARLKREQEYRSLERAGLGSVYDQIAEGKAKELKLIIKGDVDGSVEALTDTLNRIPAQEVKLRVIHTGIGAINESDVLLALASKAVIIGFHVHPDLRAREIAQREKIVIKLYDIIYDAEREIKSLLEGLLEPEKQEQVSGVSEVRNVFKISKVGQVAGLYVQSGIIKRADRVRIIRDGISIYEGNISSLKRFKEDVKEVSSGFECGVKIENFNDLKVGDIIEAYQITELARKLQE
ncbi:MAG TPA: translation initiation factor IF-2 [Terriglobales bacterium]|nr:translation initiation factor IF-2 [Terriglobales bacterium]